jgi:antirestriction protein ArdC
MNKNKEKRDVYQMVTARIIAELEQGVVPWKKPWTEAGPPMNLISRKPYRGINVLLLASLGYKRNFFLSFNQIENMGVRIKEGERGHMVVFWKWVEKEDWENPGKMKRIPFLRYYKVFNVDQCEGMLKDMVPEVVIPNDPIQACEDIIDNMPQRPEIVFREPQAYYHPGLDYVNMPEIGTFIDCTHYYNTLFHELIHSTGHESRLNRKEIMDKNPFGSESYSIEELTAEMGAAYLKSFAGIASNKFRHNASYIQGWLNKLRNDSRFIVYAATQAQRATDFILGAQNEQEYEVRNEYVPGNEHASIPELA